MFVNTVPLKDRTFLSPSSDLASCKSESLLLVSDSVTARPDLDNKRFLLYISFLVDLFKNLMVIGILPFFLQVVMGGLCPHNRYLILDLDGDLWY